MARLDAVINVGRRLAFKERMARVTLIPQKGAQTLDNLIIVQKLKNKDITRKVVTFREGSEMRRLGITDTYYSKYSSGESGITILHVDDKGNKTQLFGGTIEAAKAFIHLLKVMASDGLSTLGEIKLNKG